MQIKLDAIDCRILRALQNDARISNQALADHAALSPSACLRRVRALEECGLLRGYHADIDPALAGFELDAVVLLNLDSSREHWHEGFLAAVGTMAEVSEAWIVAGPCNYILKVRTRNLKDYSTFIVEKLQPVPGVRDICSYIVLRVVKSRQGLPIMPS